MGGRFSAAAGLGSAAAFAQGKVKVNARRLAVLLALVIRGLCPYSN